MNLRFPTTQQRVLTTEELAKKAPTVFMTAPSRELSSKYVHIPTSRVVEDLRKLGWHPVNANQRMATKKGTSQFSKHMVTFQNPDIVIKGENQDDALPQIILTNSHDGLSSFKFMIGIYRLVCSNGLVVADKEFTNFKIRHMGYSFEELQEVVFKAVEDLPNKVEILNKMKGKILSKEEKYDLAMNGMLIRAGIKPASKEAKEFEYDEDTLIDILDPKRPADNGSDLWTVFNVVQEKIVNGEFSAALKGAKVRKVRAIRSFEKNLAVNQELFKLATAMV